MAVATALAPAQIETPAAARVEAPPDIGDRDLDADEKRWTLDELLRARELGVILPDEDYELLEGRLIRKMPQKNPHRITVVFLVDALRAVYGVGVTLITHSNLDVSPETSPEPDVSLFPGPSRDWDGRDLVPAEALLAIEVSDTTLRKDRGYKAKLYARLNIPEYWIVDLNARRVEVRQGPLPDGTWTLTRLYAEDDALPAPNSTETIPIATILPAPTAA